MPEKPVDWEKMLLRVSLGDFTTDSEEGHTEFRAFWNDILKVAADVVRNAGNGTDSVDEAADLAHDFYVKLRTKGHCALRTRTGVKTEMMRLYSPQKNPFGAEVKRIVHEALLKLEREGRLRRRALSGKNSENGRILSHDTWEPVEPRKDPRRNEREHESELQRIVDLVWHRLVKKHPQVRDPRANASLMAPMVARELVLEVSQQFWAAISTAQFQGEFERILGKSAITIGTPLKREEGPDEKEKPPLDGQGHAIPEQFYETLEKIALERGLELGEQLCEEELCVFLCEYVLKKLRQEKAVLEGLGGLPPQRAKERVEEVEKMIVRILKPEADSALWDVLSIGHTRVVVRNAGAQDEEWRDSESRCRSHLLHRTLENTEDYCRKKCPTSASHLV